eukprot:35252-Chlamydomonas_euryale.AAC.9
MRGDSGGACGWAADGVNHAQRAGLGGSAAGRYGRGGGVCAVSGTAGPPMRACRRQHVLCCMQAPKHACIWVARRRAHAAAACWQRSWIP